MPANKTPAGTQFENKVRGNLRRIGLRDVDGGPTFVVGGFQVDAVGGWDDVLLVAEATQTSRKNASLRNRIVEIRGKMGDLQRGFAELEAYRGYRRFEFALITKGFDFSETDRQLAESQRRVHLIDDQVIEYYQRLAGTIGKQASVYNFLGELGVEPRDIAVHRSPAFKVELQKNLVGYLFFCEPQKLLEIAYVARRETGRGNYYQRMLTTSRLKDIRNFIDDGGIFANNVILAFDDKPQFKSHNIPSPDAPSWLQWGDLTFPKSYRAAWIIDGQHRLYAFGGEQGVSRLQKLPVFAFEQLTESKQAAFFIEINKEQKPVSPDLIWDLEADLRPESSRGRIALTAKRLNQSSPLKDKIYFPLSGEAPRGKIKISSICNDIDELRLLEDQTRNMTPSQRNPLVHGIPHESRINRVSDGISRFLAKVLDVPEGQAYRDSIILRPGGVTLILSVYEQALIRIAKLPQDDQLEEYATALVLSLDQVVGGRAAATTFVKNRLTSYSQRREVITQIVSSMRGLLNDQNFGQGVEIETSLERRVKDVERKLAKLVADTLQINTIRDLKQKAPEDVWRKVEKMSERYPSEALHALFGLGEIKQMVIRRDNKPVLIGKLTSEFRNEAEIFVALDGLMELRNPLQHGRTIQNQRLGEAYLLAFERLLESV